MRSKALLAFSDWWKSLAWGSRPCKGGKHLPEIRESPFHGDFILPVELFLTGLGGGIDKDRALVEVEAEADHAAIAAGVWLIDGVIGGALGGGGGG